MEKPTEFRAAKARKEESVFQEKYLKKYMFSIGVISLGVFMGGVVTLGIFAGLFAAAGTSLSMERLKETYPEGYNWVIDHPGWIEVATTIGFTGVFGLTATGVVASLVANILTSVVLDYYAEKEGRIPGLETLTFGAIVKKLFGAIRDTFRTLKHEIKAGIQELKGSPAVDTSILYIESDVVLEEKVA
jgi:hypothetical protein